MLKFIAGPTLGYAGGFSMITSILITVGGMMASVLLFTFLGRLMREKFMNRFFKNRKIFTKRNRRFVKIWRKYGLPGVAFLTPLIFTPIGGTILLVSFGGSKQRILIFMFLSAVFWSVFFCVSIYTFGARVFPEFMNKG